MNHLLLLIEPDELLAAMLMKQLQQYDLVCSWRQVYHAGAIEAAHAKYDAIIVNCAKSDGTQVIKRIRAREITTPILAMLPSFNENAINSSTIAGADAFLALPYNMEMLKTKLTVMLNKERLSGQVLHLGEVNIYKQKREVNYLDRKIDLKKREFDILLLLAEHRGRVIRRGLLNDATTLHSRMVTDTTVDVHVSNIRTKFRKAGVRSNLIDTIYGVGYRIS